MTSSTSLSPSATRWAETVHEEQTFEARAAAWGWRQLIGFAE